MATKKIAQNNEEPETTGSNNSLKANMVGRFAKANSELEILIRAKQPIIYLHSNESEDRIIRIINDICRGKTTQSKYTRNLFIWDAASGITQREFNTNSYRILTASAETKDPVSVLDHIINSDTSMIACYVLCEFHHYLDNPGVMRRLRNFAENTAQSQHKNIILLSPDNNGMSNGKLIPPEMENIFYILDWPLPDEAVLNVVFEDEIIPAINRQFEKTKKQLINFNEEDMDKVVKSSKGLTIHETKTAAYRSAVETFSIVPEIILSSKKQIVKKKGLIDYIEPKEEYLNDLGGMNNLKSWLNARKPILSDDAVEFGCDLLNGVMLLGPWGTGKSSVAKAIINEWKLPGLRVDAAKMFDAFVGSTERNVSAALKLAEAVAPCILWFDECDDLFSGSESSSHSDGGTTSRAIGIISTWMAEHEGMVFNIFTANDISHRPPKLFRKGRIDEIFIIDLPVESERKDIFKIHFDKRRPNGSANKMNWNLLAAESKMFSGAEIREAVNSGFIAAYNDKKRDVKTEDILNAIRITIPISCTMKEKLMAMRKWQEGRAVRASENKPEEIVDIETYRQLDGKTCGTDLLEF